MSEKTIDHSSRDHYRNGGSQISKRLLCPASLIAEDKILAEEGEPEESAYALAGTRVHECIESLLPVAIGNWDQDDKFKGAPKLLSYDEAEIESAKLACLDVLSILGGLAPQVGWEVENKMVLSEELELGGTADFVWGFKRNGIKVGGIWDYKNGVQPVDARTTRQLELYAAAMNKSLGGKEGFEQIETHIFQPNSLNSNTYKTSKVFTKEQLKASEQEFIRGAEIALGRHGEDAQLQFNPGEEQCKWCAAKPKCKAHHSWQHDKALHIFDAYDPNTPAKKIPTKDPKEIVTELSDEQLLEFFKQIEYIEGCVKAVKEYITARNKGTNPIPGTKLIVGLSRRQWRKDLEINEIGSVLKEAGIAKPFKKNLLTIGDIEKKLKKLDLDKNSITELLSEVTSKTTPGLKLVIDSEHDDRPAVGNTLESMQNLLETHDKQKKNKAKTKKQTKKN